MKSNTKKIKDWKGVVAAAMMLFSINTTSWAVDYVTIQDGNWNNPSIWSINGGTSSCGCVPGIPTNGDNITISNQVTLAQHLDVNAGSTFNVTSTGSLLGATFNLTTWGGSNLSFQGPCQFRKIINGLPAGNSGSTIDIKATVGANARVELYAGTTTLEGGFLYLTIGNFNVYQNASFVLSSTSKLELFGGNVSNAGYIYLCAECCITSTGNWENETTGTVDGEGSATTTSGNMTNNNIWSTDITWCSVGFDFGMPSLENCATSTTTCGQMMLPIELTEFNGINRGRHNEIYWVTTTETNSSYFKVLKSTDGFNWFAVDEVAAAGNSIDSKYYSINDMELTADVNYYRLEQVDLDGTINRSPVISVLSFEQMNELMVFPNPITIGGLLNVTSVSKDGVINIYDLQGSKLISHAVSEQNGSVVIRIDACKPGIYIVDYTHPNISTVQFKKIVVE